MYSILATVIILHIKILKYYLFMKELSKRKRQNVEVIDLTADKKTFPSVTGELVQKRTFW